MADSAQTVFCLPFFEMKVLISIQILQMCSTDNSVTKKLNHFWKLTSVYTAYEVDSVISIKIMVGNHQLRPFWTIHDLS